MPRESIDRENGGADRVADDREVSDLTERDLRQAVERALSTTRGMDRGEFLKRATVAELALLAALTPSAASAAVRAMSAKAAAPRRGGTLNVGVIGNGPSESFSPVVVNAPIDYMHVWSVYDTLVRTGPRFDHLPGLALNWVSNKDATKWEIHLRPGVEFHDGSAFTADDVIYSLRLYGNPKAVGYHAVSGMQLNNLSKKGKYVVVVPMKRPIARLADYFIEPATAIVKNGTKSFAKPIGTGPFKFQSFTPGQQSVGVRNPNYWDHGKPYVDQLVLQSITDPPAAVDALGSGQLQAVYPVPFPIAAAKKKNPSSASWQLVEQLGGFNQTFYMRVDQPPFNDPRVQLAMKLIPDRPHMIEVALAGFGEVGNDLFGKGLPNYDSSIPQRHQDIAHAKSLLKQAGQSDLQVTLSTSTALPGLTDAATVFQQDAAKAGVKVNVKTVPPASYFNPNLLYLKMPFAQESWEVSSLGQIYSLVGLTGAPFNESHLHDSAFDTLASKAIGTLNSAQASATWRQAQKEFWNKGGQLVWANRHSTSGFASNVRGFEQGWFVPLGDMKPQEWWLTG